MIFRICVSMALENEYEIFFISFHRKGTDSYNCLSTHKGQKPEDWHIELLKNLIKEYEAGGFDEPTEDDYSDMC